MCRKKGARSVIHGVLFLSGLLPASQAYGQGLTVDDLKVSAYMDNGRFQTKDTNFTGEYISRTGTQWKIDKDLTDQWSVSAMVHLLFWRNQLFDKALFHVAGLKFDSDMEGYLTWKNEAQQFKAGVYDFKYNPDSKDLGEYLLRCTSYPTIIENMQGKDLFAPSFARVMGIEYGLEYEYFRTKAGFFLEQFHIPINDANLAFFASAGPKTSEVGLGVAVPRVLRFGDRSDVAPLEPMYEKYIDNKDLGKNEVKLSLRGRLDLASFLSLKEPFTLYAEGALLGLKNDTTFYKNTADRMPVMVGVDIPTFGILSGFSLEVERFKTPYMERKYLKKVSDGLSHSVLPALDNYDELPTKTPPAYRWSAQLERSLNQWFAVNVRLTNNHMRLLSWDEDYVNGEPFNKTASDWLCLVRLEYHN
jgi:hypothetical protein